MSSRFKFAGGPLDGLEFSAEAIKRSNVLANGERFIVLPVQLLQTMKGVEYCHPQAGVKPEPYRYSLYEMSGGKFWHKRTQKEFDPTQIKP